MEIQEHQLLCVGHGWPGQNLASVAPLLPRITQGLIVVADSNDIEHVNEVHKELMRMPAEDKLRDTVLLVFTNKQDLPNAMNAAKSQTR